MNSIIKIRILFWTILAVIVLVLFYLAVVPFGKITYSTDFCNSSEFIGEITPEERLGDFDGCSQKIIGDPVYFSLRTPRTFDKAKLTIKYKTSEDYPGIIEIGNLVDKIVWRYDLKPIENEMINKLSLVWNKTQADGVVLLQKEKKYETIENFLNEFKKDDSEINNSEVLLYNYDLKPNFILGDYAPKEEFNYIKAPLRGSYQFYTYIKEEDLNFNFSFIDLNKNKDGDVVEIIIYYQDQILETKYLEDDGISEDNGRESNEREVDLNLANMPEGAYKVEVKANDDIITKNIKTKQAKISFINKIWLFDQASENINIYTDSNYLQFNAVSPQGTQTIMVDGKDLNIEETYNQYAVDVWRASSTDLSEIILEKDGIIISGNGLFSFNRDSFFDPVLKRLDQKTDMTEGNIKYILANYKIPQKDGEWKIASQEFDLKKAYREFYKYGFIISVPELDSEDGIDDWIEVGEIEIELVGRSLWDKLKEFLGDKL